METLIVIIIVLVGIGYLLKYLRQREIEKFMDSDMADFQTFQITQKKSTKEPVSQDKILAKAEAYAALNPDAVKLNRSKEDDTDLIDPTVAPDPRLYSQKPDPFDEVTRHMLARLNEVTSDEIAVLWQVPLSEIAFIDDDPSANYKLSTHHIRYLLYKTKDMSLICGVQHQDRGSQGKPGGDFVKGVFQDLGLPLLEFPVSADISELEIRDQLDPILVSRESKTCPKCGQNMNLRRAVKGKHQGKMYWVCAQFPGCRAVIQLT